MSKSQEYGLVRKVVELVLEEEGYVYYGLEKKGKQRYELRAKPEGRGMTINDCVKLSRRIRKELEAGEAGAGAVEDVVVDVSSPGIEAELGKKRKAEGGGLDI